MTLMHAGLLQDILEHPDDDTPRLILADWLEDHGQEPYADFIRTQIAVGLDGAGKPCWPTRLSRYRPEWEAPFRSVGMEVMWRRGFVDSLSCNCAAWLAHGPELVRCQPLQRVRLSDREPYQPDWGDDRSWYWFATVPETGTHPSPIVRPCHAIPDELAVKHFVYLDGWWNGWASREDAKSALSEVCLVWAKRLPLESSAVLKRMRLRAAPATQEALT